MTDTIRLAKRVAQQIACSRNDAEQYIEGGWVTVDGVVTEEAGARIGAAQSVALLPEAVLGPIEPVTILYHKPAGARADLALETGQDCIGMATLAADDRSGLRFLQRHARALQLTNPLEDTASGLLVLTQDWRIVRKLVDDASRIEQEFVVEVEGTLSPEGLALLQHGVSWNGKPLTSIKVSWQSEQRLRFALKNAQRGMIAHLCEHAGLRVVSCKRIRIGRIPLAALPVGQWRYLLGYERF